MIAVAAMLMLAAGALCAQKKEASPASAAPAGNLDNGKKLFTADGCYECHGRAAQGGAGPRIGPPPLAFPALLAYIRHPKGQMPPYTAKVLSDADAADIYAFLQSIPKPPDPKTIPLLNQ